MHFQKLLILPNEEVSLQAKVIWLYVKEKGRKITTGHSTSCTQNIKRKEQVRGNQKKLTTLIKV